jgi:hypothetical protein
MGGVITNNDRTVPVSITKTSTETSALQRQPPNNGRNNTYLERDVLVDQVQIECPLRAVVDERSVNAVASSKRSTTGVFPLDMSISRPAAIRPSSS